MATEFTNTTANQHYVSQTEQRLNAINPKVKPENQRIYDFSVVDPERFTVSLDSPNGRSISQSLSLRDLFSFDVLPDARQNFEDNFKGYEDTIHVNTLSLLAKLEKGGDIKGEILTLFVAKFMNSLRNPFSIKSALKAIAPLFQFVPTDPETLKQFETVLNGSKPQETYLCEKLGITKDEYRRWLGGLFMILKRFAPDQPNMMEGLVKSLFENPTGFPMICVNLYASEEPDKVCLLSDRGFSHPLPDPHLSYDFNLTSKAFITYLFAPIEQMEPFLKLPPERRAQLIETYKKIPKNVPVHTFVDDFDKLARYNQNVVRQAHRKVFCSSATIHGVMNNG